MASVFDTHATVKELVNAGLSEAQAEALTRALQRGIERGDLVTKADLKTELAQLETRLLRWMFVQVLTIIAILFGLLHFT